MKVLYLGFAVSEEMFAHVLATDRGLPVQTHRFGWSVIDGLRSQGNEVAVLSAEPTADFPHNARWLVRGRRFAREHQPGRSISFVNLPFLKHLTRYLAVLARARGRSGRDLSQCDAIVVHGVHSAFLWAALRLGRRWGVPVVPLITDAPSLRTDFDNGLTSLLKMADQRLVVAATRRVDGVVALSGQLAADLAPQAPSLLIEGLARDEGALVHVPAPGHLRVVYAGSLHRDYGVLDLVAALDRPAARPWELAIYGRGDAAEEIAQAAIDRPRLTYGGAVAPESMGDVYASADILVNPRPPDTALAANSFPSKLLEYLASGVPVVSTRLPNLPDDLAAHLTLAEAGPAGLAEAVGVLAAVPDAQRVAQGEAARRHVLRTRGTAASGRRIAEFLTQVASAEGR